MKYETWYVNNCDQESILIHADKYEEKFPRENLSFMYGIKGTVKRDFRPPVFFLHKSNLPGPLVANG